MTGIQNYQEPDFFLLLCHLVKRFSNQRREMTLMLGSIWKTWETLPKNQTNAHHLIITFFRKDLEQPSIGGEFVPLDYRVTVEFKPSLVH